MQDYLGTIHFCQVTSLTSNRFIVLGYFKYFLAHSGGIESVPHGIHVSLAQEGGALITNGHKVCGSGNFVPGLSVFVYGFHIRIYPFDCPRLTSLVWLFLQTFPVVVCHQTAAQCHPAHDPACDCVRVWAPL